MCHSYNGNGGSIIDSTSHTTRRQGHGTDDGPRRLARKIPQNPHTPVVPECQMLTIAVLLHHTSGYRRVYGLRSGPRSYGKAVPNSAVYATVGVHEQGIQDLRRRYTEPVRALVSTWDRQCIENGAVVAGSAARSLRVVEVTAVIQGDCDSGHSLRL